MPLAGEAPDADSVPPVAGKGVCAQARPQRGRGVRAAGTCRPRSGAWTGREDPETTAEVHPQAGGGGQARAAADADFRDHDHVLGRLRANGIAFRGPGRADG